MDVSKRYVILICMLLLASSCGGKKGGEKINKLETHASPPGGTYREDELPIYVTLETNRPSTVYYTLDGSSPIPGRANTYSAPSPVTGIKIEGDALLRFFAEDSQGNRESVKTEKYEIDKRPRTFALPPGGRFAQPITVTLSASEPATIYYTMDGRDPTPEDYDNTCANSCEVQIPCSAEKEECTITLKFFSIDSTGIEESAVRTETYIIDRKKPVTYVQPPGGQYDSPQTVNLLASEPATIYYCTDGGVPSTDPDNFIENGGCTYRAENSAAIEVKDHTILRFFSVDKVGNREDVRTEMYRIGNAPIAVLDPPPGLYSSVPFVVSVTSIPEPATFYYTLDGTDVDKNSSPSCNTPCTFAITQDEATLVKYIITDGVHDDRQREALYILDVTPPTTTADPSGNYYTEPVSVTISANENDVTVFYRVVEGTTGCTQEPSSYNSGKAPVRDISISGDAELWYYGVDRAGNSETPKCETYKIYGRYTEDFRNDTYVDAQSSTAKIDYVRGEVSLKIGQPEIVNSLNLTSNVQSLDSRGWYLLGSAGAQGIMVFDISVPDEPILLGNYLPEAGRNYIAVKVYGPYLLASWTSNNEWGIDLINASDPSVLAGGSAPPPITTFSEPRNPVTEGSKVPYRIDVLNNYIFVSMALPGASSYGAGSALVKLYTDYSTSISFIARVNAPTDFHYYQSLLLDGKFAYGGGADNWLQSFLIEDPSNPPDFPSTVSKSISFSGPIYDILKVKNYLILLVDAGSTSRLRVVDATDPGNLILKSYYVDINADTPYRLRKAGSLLYVATSARLGVFDVSDPAQPQKLVVTDSPGCFDLVIMGNYGYCASPTGELITLRINQKTSLSVSQTVDLSSSITKVDITGDYLYAVTSSGITLFDPISLTQEYFISVTQANDFQLFGKNINGQEIGVAGASWGFSVFSLVTTGAVKLKNILTSFPINELLLSGWRGFVASGGDGCGGFDFSNPLSPEVRSYFQVSGDSCSGLDADGPDIYSVFTATGLHILNATSLSNMAEIGGYNTVGTPMAVDTIGGLTLIADGPGGLVILDTYNRASPGFFATYSAGSALDVVAHGLRAYLAGGSDGLRSVNLQVPDVPLGEGYLDMSNASSVAHNKEYIFVANGSQILKVKGMRPLSTYRSNGVVVSKNINTSGLNVAKARIQINASIPEGTSVTLFITNNGGDNWYQVYPGELHTFPFAGSDLRWKAELKTSDPRKSPVLKSITIIYYYE